MNKEELKKYEPGKIINCKGIKGVIIFPRKRGMISVVWQGMDDIDDYSLKWLEENCFINEEMFAQRHRFPRF